MKRKGRGLFVVCAVSLAVTALLLGGCLFQKPNHPPVAAFEVVPDEGYVPLPVRFDASGSYDPDGDPITYEWDFGDGGSSSEPKVVHTYAEGVYTASLHVTDPDGLSDTATAVITVRPIPEGYRLHRYEWTYEGEVQRWDVLVTEYLYQMYRGRIRTPFLDNYQYRDYVIDSLDDPTIEDLAGELWNRVGKDPIGFAEYTLGFVQGAILYREDPAGAEWPLYPLETLVDGVGDCEDTAILYVSFLRAEGIPCKLAFVDTDGDTLPDHTLALVRVDPEYVSEIVCTGGERVTVLPFGDELYAVVETATDSASLRLGCDPWGLAVDDLVEVWSFQVAVGRKAGYISRVRLERS